MTKLVSLSFTVEIMRSPDYECRSTSMASRSSARSSATWQRGSIRVLERCRRTNGKSAMQLHSQSHSRSHIRSHSQMARALARAIAVAKVIDAHISRARADMPEEHHILGRNNKTQSLYHFYYGCNKIIRSSHAYPEPQYGGAHRTRDTVCGRSHLFRCYEF